MQIKLIPASPNPTILFNITLSDPPDSLGIPQAWATQLQRIGYEELEYPQTLLALDKTTWIIACLRNVTFDLSGTREGSDEGEEVGAEGEEKEPGRITCVFIDGKTVEWDLTAVQLEDEETLACLDMLQSVCRDVQDSAVEAERERMRYHVPDPRLSTPLAGSGGQANANEKGESKKQGKHKKQRSLLMSLVASLVSPRLSSQTQPTPSRPSSPPPQPVTVRPTPVVHFTPTTSLSTVLRKRARSTLVDAFRRYVLSKLTTTLLPACTSTALQPTYNSHIGYYSTWVAQSLLERIETEMDDMVREAGGIPGVYMHTRPSHLDNSAGELSWRCGAHAHNNTRSQGSFGAGEYGGENGQTSVDETLPPFLDDAGTDETDDSSVHTPSDSGPVEESPFIPARSKLSSPPVSNKHAVPSPSLPRSPSPPTPPTLSPPLDSSLNLASDLATESPSSSLSSSITFCIPQPSFTPTALNAFTALSTHRHRLRNLLRRFAAQANALASEEHSLQVVLEVKARRRAWSNRDYMRKDSADMLFLGFAIPTRRSPLGLHQPICAADIVVVSPCPSNQYQAGGYAVEGVHGLERLKRTSSDGLVVTTAEHNIMRLFPVCEEDEDEDDHDSSYPLFPSRADISVVGQAEAGFDADIPSVRLVEDSILRDAEAGLLTPLPLQRHSVPIRPRTRSMIHPPPTPPFTPPASPTLTLTPSVESITTFFSEPENEKVELDVFEPQTKVELFDVYSGEDEDDDGPTPGEMGFKSEFTLSMDLPPPYRMGIGMHAMSRKYDNWGNNRTTGTEAR